MGRVEMFRIAPSSDYREFGILWDIRIRFSFPSRGSFSKQVVFFQVGCFAGVCADCPCPSGVGRGFGWRLRRRGFRMTGGQPLAMAPVFWREELAHAIAVAMPLMAGCNFATKRTWPPRPMFAGKLGAKQLRRAACSGAVRHGAYGRKTQAGMRIFRWYCRRYHTTFNSLPDCSAARFPGTLQAMGEMVAEAEALGSLWAAARSGGAGSVKRPLPDSSAVRANACLPEDHPRLVVGALRAYGREGAWIPRANGGACWRHSWISRGFCSTHLPFPLSPIRIRPLGIGRRIASGAANTPWHQAGRLEFATLARCESDSTRRKTMSFTREDPGREVAFVSLRHHRWHLVQTRGQARRAGPGAVRKELRDSRIPLCPGCAAADPRLASPVSPVRFRNAGSTAPSPGGYRRK